MTTTPAPCPPAAEPAALQLRPIAFAEIPRGAWDRLLALTPAATPFSRWTFHRAWWDAYGPTAHEQYLVADAAEGDATPDRIRGIVPLMHRHEVEAGDAASATILRRTSHPGTDVAPDAKAVFMAASYHADYATLLAAPADLPELAQALVETLAGPPDAAHGSRPWDVVDLRRLRGDDPALPALETAFRAAAAANGWSVRREEEDVCPVVTLPDGDWEAYVATLGKKDRHELRRKLRRVDAVGEIRLSHAPLSGESVDDLIRLHQARWGAEGLFPATEGGDRSRRFLHRLTELEALEGPDAQLQLVHVRVGDLLIFAGVGFDDGSTTFFYNAGSDPEARELSPGVTGSAAYLRDRIAAGRKRFDFLRGDEPYKYEWGAVDETVQRLLITRRP